MSTVLGGRYQRPDGLGKVTGAARYAADLSVPGLAHACFLYAERPHARIVKLDTARARSLPGVLAILTHEDVPPVRYGMFVKDRTLFATDVVRFEGEIVAAVAAVTPELARTARSLIEVEYEPLDPILSAEAALEADSPLVHPDWEDYAIRDGVDRRANDGGHFTTVKGDVEQGFAEADVVLREIYRTDMSHAVPIEPHAILAEWRGESVTIHSTTQVPYPARSGVAETLQMPESRVRIVVPPLGGGFGGKCDFHFEAHVAALARAAGRPVRLVFSRREEFVATDKVRHPMVIELETGAKSDGTITARRARLVLDSGAYVGDALFAAEIGLMMVTGAYRIPHVHASAHTVYTNKTPAGSVRAPGGPQVCWAVEQHTDVLAAKLGLDPRELRLRNLVREGDTGPTGQRFDHNGAVECLERATEKAGWGKPLEEDEALGIACGWWFSLPVPSGAYVKLNGDGSGSIITGAQENGSGSVMALALLAAEELGMRPEDFSITYQDTDVGPWDLGSAGSQTTINNGRAVIAAATEVREQLLELASEELEASPSDLELVDGQVQVRGASSRAVSIATLAAKAHGGALLLGRGSGLPPAVPEHDLAGCVGRLGYSAFAAPSFYCHVARVRVDRATGVVRVLEMTAAHDFGRVLNPTGAEGQVEGGVVHGVGIALLEGTAFEDGHQRNPHLLDYKLQTGADAPPINVIFVDTKTPTGFPHDAKAVGEPPVVPPAAAVANAIAAAAGARVRRLPMTPERVWSAINGESA
ncbi:MAG TPA: xanthine dehydrogenase family protein molybdopterin-binding subunit [Solirubrobacteraceae bacterium]